MKKASAVKVTPPPPLPHINHHTKQDPHIMQVLVLQPLVEWWSWWAEKHWSGGVFFIYSCFFVLSPSDVDPRFFDIKHNAEYLSHLLLHSFTQWFLPWTEQDRISPMGNLSFHLSHLAVRHDIQTHTQVRASLGVTVQGQPVDNIPGAAGSGPCSRAQRQQESDPNQQRSGHGHRRHSHWSHMSPPPPL